ncbi:MAG: LysR family transcriptional regulator [Nevskia sp.]|nr:LysR family transcriptional regulator [Nevskia sp.]
MQTRRRLPPLDLLRGFEAAARHLSFTKAAAELHLTQSAISRQVQALEEHVGQPLFERRHRALALTEPGQQLQQAVSAWLAQLADTFERIAPQEQSRLVTVTTTVSFASLWLLPRLAAFRLANPGVDVRISADGAVVDLGRARIDTAIRYCAPERAPPGAQRLFGETVLPLCSPSLQADLARPLRVPADLCHHVLLHFDDQPPRQLFLDWDHWLEAMGLPELRPAGVLRFSHYDQVIQAAIEGQGVALGRLPLMERQLKRGQLVAPFDLQRLPGHPPSSSRAYFVLLEPAAAQRPEVRDFAAWLHREAAPRAPDPAAQ